jgi:acetyltransferase-like isoleucine patch superfamily enzyme
MIAKGYYLIKYLYYKIFYRFYRLGWPVGFESNVAIKNPSYISFGNNVYIGVAAAIQIPEEHSKYRDHRPKIIIGDKVTIGMGTTINAADRIEIKKNVLIAPHCYITDHQHRYTDVKTPIRFQGLDSVKPVIIGEAAWIGANVLSIRV